MSQLIERFKTFYQDLDGVPVAEFQSIYADDVIFRDPIHEIRGSSELLTYMEKLTTNLEQCKFEYLDQIWSEDKAYIKWNMNFCHPRFGDRVHTVRGASHIQFNDRIYYQEDLYDMGQMVYEHLPLIGNMTRWVKRRMAG